MSALVDDLSLARACDEGDPRAWARLRTVYVPRLTGLARARGLAGSTAADAVDDLLQDVALPAPGGAARTLLGTYAGTGSLFGWLAAVLVRRIARAARKGARRAEVVEGVPAARPGEDDPLSALLDEERRARFERAIDAAWGRCTRNERLAILSTHRHGLLQREVARVLGVGRPRVTRLLAAGIERLRAAALDALGGDAPEGRRAWDAFRGTIDRHLARMAPLEATEPPSSGREGNRSDHHTP